MELLVRFARYSLWVDDKVFRACGRLSADDYFRKRPVFFGSIHGTLNHVLAVDRIGLGRIEATDSGVRAIDEVLCPDLASLWAARRQVHERVIALTESLDAAGLDRVVPYRDEQGRDAPARLGDALLGLLNHQAHHRGQVYTMLFESGIDLPGYDIVEFARQSG